MNDSLTAYRVVCTPALDDAALAWALKAHQRIYGRAGRDRRLYGFDPAAWCGWRPRSYVVKAPWWDRARARGRP